MLIKVPTLKRVIEKDASGNETIKRLHGELVLTIDTSFLAHYKWEEHFAASMHCDLSAYTERVRHLLADPNRAKAEMLSMLKLLYCYVSSDQLPTFKEFLQLFDYEIADEILKRISVVLEEVGKSVSKNS